MDVFNSTTNSVLDPVFANPAIASTLKLFLVLYGGLAAPSIPSKVAPLFTNSLFRIFIMFLIVWTFNHDPALSIIVAVVYFLSLTYLVKNSLAQVQQTGVVTPEIALVISGGNGPSIKSSSVKQQEASLMQSSVDASKSPGYLVSPEAVLDGPGSTVASAHIPTTPSGNLAENPSMMASSPDGGVPLAYSSESLSGLASVPE